VSFLRAVWSFLVFVGRLLTYGWILALIDLVRRVCEILGKLARRPPGRSRKMSPYLCNPISEQAFRRPDPLIYSQSQLMALGLAVTWDNPDIVLQRNGADVPSSQLQPDTEYDVMATIWNGSTDAPAPGLPVSFSYLSFGIGVESHTIGRTAVSLGVKGGPDHPAFARMRWRTPAAAGHYCLQVLLEPIDDLNPSNNLGQENTQVGSAHSPADLAFQLRNRGTRDETFRFEVDAYAIPEQRPCSERPPEQPDPRHHRRNHPVPAGWSVVMDPSEPRLAPDAEATIHVRVTPPDSFHGRQPLNVNAFDAHGLAGGVTFYVERA
jgi:hypothetical protein